MKKLIAWLLILLLPVTALGESYHFTLAVDVETEQVDALLGDALNTDATAKLISGIARLLGNTSLQITTQEDAFAFAMTKGNEDVIDFAFHMIGEDFAITSSLFPEHVLRTEVGELSLDDPALLAEVEKLMAHFAEVILKWSGTLEISEESGTFDDLAYSGGTHRSNVKLTSSDVLRLLNDLGSEDMRALLDAMDLLSAFNALCDALKSGPQYELLLQFVTVDSETLIGISAFLRRDGALLTTASLGCMDGENLRLIIGRGAENRNLWNDVQMKLIFAGNDMIITGSHTESFGDKGKGIVNETLLANTTLSVRFFGAQGTLNWEYTADTTIDDKASVPVGFPAVQSIVGSGTLTTVGSFALEAFETLRCDGNDVIRLHFLASPVDPIAAPADSLIVCAPNSASPTDAALYEEIIAKASGLLAERIITLVPLDLIFTLTTFFE